MDKLDKPTLLIKIGTATLTKGKDKISRAKLCGRVVSLDSGQAVFRDQITINYVFDNFKYVICNIPIICIFPFRLNDL